MDQKSTSWNAPYTFTGKIKDTETGYNYFGARYYDSGLSVWLSVDPLSDKYPSMSPYTYCANNPVILVDPDGEQINIFGILYTPGGSCPTKDSKGNDVSETTKFIWNALEKINQHSWGNKVIQELSSSTTLLNYNHDKMISVVSLFQKRSMANKEGLYNSPRYKLFNYENQRSLLEKFPSLN